MNHIRPICNLSQLPFILKSYQSERVKIEVENVAENCDAIFKRLDGAYGDKGIDSLTRSWLISSILRGGVRDFKLPYYL